MKQKERNEILRHIEVEKAYLDGKAIELKSAGGATWTLVDWKPSWNWAEFDYRVKPEPPKPQYRPFENAEEVMEAIKEHGDIVIGSGIMYLKITAFTSEDVKFGTGKFMEYKDAYAAYTFADDTPFGKLIEE